MATTNHVMSSQKEHLSVEQAKQMIQKAMEQKSAAAAGTVSIESKLSNFEFNIPISKEARTFAMVQSDVEKSDAKSDQSQLEDESKRIHNQHCLCEEEISRMRDKFLLLKPSGSNFDRDQATSLINKYTFDQMKSIYKKDGKGQLTFQMSFQLNNFEMEDIQVLCCNYRLQIVAQQTKNQFSRTLNLPRTLDLKQIKCSFTQDGVLLLEAPVLPSIDTPTENMFAINGPLTSTFGQLNNSSMARNGQIVQKVAVPSPQTPMVEEKRELNIQISVGKEYSCEEVSVSIIGNHLFVCARHENKQDDCTAFREFEKQFELPKDTDYDNLRATFSNGILCIQSSLHKESKDITTITSANLLVNEDSRNSSICQEENCRTIQVTKE